MTPDEAVELATRMRAAGVARFVLTKDRFSAVMLPAPPPPMADITERIGEMEPKQRIELLKKAQKDLDDDLYSASG